MLSEELIIELKQLARCELIDIRDFAKQHYEHIFHFGVNQGMTFLARKILDNLDIPYETYD